MYNKHISTFLAAASLALALIVLSGCGHSDPPAKAPAPAPAASAAKSHPPQELTAANSPALTDETPGDARVSPEQIPYVGAAPPGEVAFGPTASDAGMDPAGDTELNALRATRQKQADAMQKQQQAAVQHVTPAPAHPAAAPAPAPTKHQ